MAQISFGRKQIGKPIPASYAFWCRVYTIVGTALIAAAKTAPFIPKDSVAEQSIEWFFTSTIGIFNLLLPMIGVTIDSATVPAEDVTVIETKTDK